MNKLLIEKNKINNKSRNHSNRTRCKHYSTFNFSGCFDSNTNRRQWLVNENSGSQKQN